MSTLGSRSAHVPPPLRDTVRFALFALVQLVGRLLRHVLMKEEWFILTRSRGGHYSRIRVPRDVYLADPWLVAKDGQNYLFAEAFDYSSGRGSIVVGQALNDGTVRGLHRALERPYHLSYPCVFEFGGDFYMIPESSANATLELYRAAAFPDDWVLEAILLDGVYAADPTVLVRNGHLWLFVTIAGSKHCPADDELFLYFAEHPMGPWTPHAANPVVSDVRHARAAGAIFESNGALVRPAQDCLRGYGYAVSLRQIDRLSPDEYFEHEIARMEPGDIGPRALGVHTYTRLGVLEAVDARRFRTRI